MGSVGYSLVGLGFAVFFLLFLASRKPDVFRIERKALIKAKPASVFPHINTLAQWDGWSPWAKKDPNVRNTPSGAASGKGAIFAWEGNRKVGKGRMEITESVPDTRVVLRLDFLKPMKNTHFSEFTLTRVSGGTEVRWAMHGPNLFMGKLMSLFISMDKMIGADFEAGLANLKKRVEG